MLGVALLFLLKFSGCSASCRIVAFFSLPHRPTQSASSIFDFAITSSDHMACSGRRPHRARSPGRRRARHGAARIPAHRTDAVLRPRRISQRPVQVAARRPAGPRRLAVVHRRRGVDLALFNSAGDLRWLPAAGLAAMVAMLMAGLFEEVLRRLSSDGVPLLITLPFAAIHGHRP